MFVMWNCKEKVKSKRAKTETHGPRCGARLMLVFFLFPFSFFLSSCRRDMQDQPKAIAYRESTFFKDGVSSRLPVEGTVPRDYLRADREFYFGKKSGYRTGSGSDRVIDSTGQQPGANP